MESRPTTRIQWLVRIVLLWAVAIVGRLIQLQVLQHDLYKQIALSQQERVVDLSAPRGTIFDRNGERLAMSVPCDSVCVNPRLIKEPEVASVILAKILNLDQFKLYQKMKLYNENGLGFMWIKRKISDDESARLHRLKDGEGFGKSPLDWIEFRRESKRVYANGGLAAHVLGGVDFEEKGNGGIEQSLDEDLAGHVGALRLVTDVRQRGYQGKTDQEAVPGKNIRLTLVSRLQYIAEQELKKAVIDHNAKWGSIVVMDPKTGEVLAMVNYPTFDPNDKPLPGSDVSARKNFAVMAPFEPGSVFKIITVSAALDMGKVRPETSINCGNGSINLFGRVIHDDHKFSQLPVEDVLAHSSNIGAINIGLRVGDAGMYEYMRRFGFGQRTGISMPGESPGIVRPLKRWQKSSIGSVAMGHEVSVTSIQLAQACSVIANGGFLVRPKLVMDGKTETPKQVLKPETAITMRRMMEGVVIKPFGTGHRYVHIPGYTAGGKTGTAKIYDNSTHSYTGIYNASFVGFAPVTDPAVVVAVTVSGSTGKAGYGGPTSAPVFSDIAAVALRLLDVPKDLPDEDPRPRVDSVGDDNDVAIADLASPYSPPLAPDADAPGQRPFLAQMGTGELFGPKVPNFIGKTGREAAQQSSEEGLPVEVQGVGIVRSQYPPPGYPLPIGQRIRVYLGR